jgi:hypothetical protein
VGLGHAQHVADLFDLKPFDVAKRKHEAQALRKARENAFEVLHHLAVCQELLRTGGPRRAIARAEP